MRFTDDLNGLPLEYQRMNGTAFRDLDVSDLINNPGANGVCSVLSLSFGEQASDLILRDLRALGDDVPNPLLVRENPVQALTSRVITLKSGGTLTVSASIDLFKLSPKDRAFVFSLIDKLESYELGDGQGDE